MLFSSITFLYYFLPVVLVLYFVAPKCMKNVVLLVSSLIFYAWSEPKYVFLMIASIISGYIFGRLIEAFSSEKKAAYILFLAIAIHVGILIYFKYAGTVNAPLGISFYTFQIVSYVADVYRGKIKASKKLIHLSLEIAMFPQLIAGPIVRYADIEKQLESREDSVSNFAAGIRRFIFGLTKKVLFANTLGELCEIFKISNDKSILFFWLYAAAFSLHIYFDFSGYSDMAIGLGRIFGFYYLENFDYPYASGSITEFWRRWHMSLGRWFLDYVYIPLGGNRVSKIKWIFNVLLVWFLTGIWHGSTWNFVLWGAFFAILLIIEKYGLYEFLQKHKVMSHFYVMFVVLVGFVIFNGTNIKESISYLGGMFGLEEYPFMSKEFVYYLKSYRIVLFAAAIGATPVLKHFMAKTIKRPMIQKVLDGLEPMVLVLLLLVVTAYLVDGSFQPFLYFRF